MNSRQERVLNSVDRVVGCMSLPPFNAPRFAPLRRELAAKQREVQSLRVEQRVDPRQSRDVRKIEAARKELRARHLIPISREGKRLLKGMPGISESLRVPHKRAKDKDLLKATARILENAEAYAPVFRKALFHRDFIKRARRAADALAVEVAIDAKRPPTRGSRATNDLKVVLAECREIIRSIDGLVEAEFFDDSVALHAWHVSKRIPKKMGRPKKRRPPESTTDDQPPA